MIDISDGLLSDLGHIAKASKVAIDLWRDAFDVPDQMRDAATALGVDPYTWVFGGGDDHPLCATFPPGVALPEPWQRIGTVGEGTGVTVDSQAWTGRTGWDHFKG